jgi:hypothetical protein
MNLQHLIIEHRKIFNMDASFKTPEKLIFFAYKP